MRALTPAEPRPGEDRVTVAGLEFAKGGKVRLCLGRRRSDAADLLLDGRMATIETIYHDYDGQVYLAVTLDDDPAQTMQRELARYLFFFPDEVELAGSGEMLISGLDRTQQNGPRSVPPHPGPLPRGEGGTDPAQGEDPASRLVDAPETVFPLPEGEGQGEGEGSAPCHQALHHPAEWPEVASKL
jgi:hypothetical protein